MAAPYQRRTFPAGAHPSGCGFRYTVPRPAPLWTPGLPLARQRCDQGIAHCWFEPPLQSQISSWVPFVVLKPGSSRHRPDTGFTSIPFTGSHCWLAPPLQVHSSTRVPLAVPAPVMSMHEPLMRIVPSVSMVQFCAAPPLQSHICTLVPLALEFPLSSTHLAVLSPAMIGPVGVVEPSGVTDRLSNWSVW